MPRRGVSIRRSGQRTPFLTPTVASECEAGRHGANRSHHQTTGSDQPGEGEWQLEITAGTKAQEQRQGSARHGQRVPVLQALLPPLQRLFAGSAGEGTVW